MRWTKEIGRDDDAVLYEVVDRNGLEVPKVRAAKRLPLLGVLVEQYTDEITPSGDELIKRVAFIPRGQLRRMSRY